MNGAAKGIIPIISIIHQSTLFFTQSHSFVKIKIYLNEYIEKTKLDIPSETIIKNTIKDSDALRYGARGIKRKVKNEIFMQKA